MRSLETRRKRVNHFCLPASLFKGGMALLALALVLAAAPAARGATLQVDTATDEIAVNGSCSLREAILNANDNAATSPDCAAGSGRDTILLPAGVFQITIGGSDEGLNLTGDFDLLDASGVVIIGSGSDVTIIEGNQLDRVFDVLVGSATFENVTIRGGMVPGPLKSDAEGKTVGIHYGGGIFHHADNESLTLVNVTLEQNTAQNGGSLAAYSINPNVAIHHSVIRESSSVFSGGGVFVESTFPTETYNLEILNSKIYENNADSNGGGIYTNVTSGTPTIEIAASCIEDNTASFAGGGFILETGMVKAIPLNGTAEIDISDTTFEENVALNGSGGGAAIVYSGTLELVVADCLFNLNQASGNGGGLHLQDFFPCAVELLSSLFTVNFASGDGGGAYLSFGEDSEVSVWDTDFLGNSGSDGGGLYTTGFSITKSDDDKGPGFSLLPSTVSIVDGTFTDNAALVCSGPPKACKGFGGGDGGGLYAEASFSIYSVTDCRFFENFAENQGGGGHVQGLEWDLSVAGAEVHDNTAQNQSGGGFSIQGFIDCSLRVSESRFERNRCLFNGGGVLAQICGSATFEETLFDHNHALDYGGGLNVSLSCLSGKETEKLVPPLGGALYIADSTFTYNLAGDRGPMKCKAPGCSVGYGGGLFVGGSDFLANVVGSLIAQNIAGNGGGGYTDQASDSDFYFAGTTIRDNTADDTTAGGGGFGFYGINNTYIQFDDCQVLNNVASAYGGGLLHSTCGDQLDILDSVIQGNVAAFNGGGIGYNDRSCDKSGVEKEAPSGGILVVGSLIASNTAEGGSGGGLEIESFFGNHGIFQSEFTWNYAQIAGGGIGADIPGAILTMASDTVSFNTAGDQGGGLNIFNDYITTNVDIDQSTFNGNAAGTNGGGISAEAEFLFCTALNSTLSANQADHHGGGISLERRIPGKADDPPPVSNVLFILNNCTVTLNIADADANSGGEGGGLFSDAVPDVKGNMFDISTGFQLANTIVAGNIDLSPSVLKVVGDKIPAIFNAPDLFAWDSQAFYSYCFNLIGNGQVHDLVTDTTDTVWTGSSMGDQVGTFAVPIDPLLGPLADNGGPSHTHALLVGSPALDMGNEVAPSSNPLPATGCVDCRPVDQRNIVRGMDGNGDGLARCDIGAYEGEPGPADFQVTKILASSPVVLGATATFQIHVANAGPGAAMNVSATDTLPLGFEYKDSSAVVSSGTVAFNDPTLEWAIGTLFAGESATLTFCATVTGSQDFVNEVFVATTSAIINPEDDQASATGTVIVRPKKIDLFPLMNEVAAARGSNVSATYDQPINPASVSPMTFAVHALETGQVTQTLTVSGAGITLDPPNLFKPGEQVEVTATKGFLSASTGLAPATSCVWQFFAAVEGGCGTLLDSGQILGATDNDQGVALGDLDGDDDVDAFTVSLTPVGKLSDPFDTSRIWLNNGNGYFSPGQILSGGAIQTGVDLGDLDGDGDLDAVVSQAGGSSSWVWLNNGDATFSFGGSLQDFNDASDVRLGDLDGDGDLDVVLVLFAAGPRIFFNDGSASFIQGQTLGLGGNHKAGDLSDLDGDGDLDLVIARDNGGDGRVLLNQGNGTFVDSGQSLGAGNSKDVRLGDLDLDGDPDAVIANFLSPHTTWYNDGLGTLVAGDPLDSTPTGEGQGVSLGDLDADGRLDVVIAGSFFSSLWLNKLTGMIEFQQLSQTSATGVDMADLDGDGDLDSFFATSTQGGAVWFNTCVADLSVEKIGPSEPVVAGGTVEYTLEITNLGPGSATDVVVTDTLPVELTFLSATPGISSETGGVVTYQLGILAASEVVSVTVQAQVSSSAVGTILNTGTVQSGSHDPASDNNQDTEETSVRSVADVSITKSDMVDLIPAMSTVIYTLEVSNAGPSDATSVSIVDVLPASTTYVSSSDDCTVNGTTVTCTLGTLPAGGVVSVTLEILIDSSFEGVLFNTATVATGTEDPNAGNNQDTEMTGVFLEADLSIAKTASSSSVVAGEAFTYTMTVTNLGPTESVDVRVTDVLPEGLTFVSASPGCVVNGATVTCDLGLLSFPGVASVTLEVLVDASYTGQVVNIATVGAETPDPESGNNTSQSVLQTEFNADVSLELDDDPDPVLAGNSYILYATVSNSGPSNATGVVLLLDLPQGTSALFKGAPNFGGGPLTLDIGSILPNTAIIAGFELGVSPSQPVGPIVVSGTATTGSLDPNPGNNTDSESTQVDARADLNITIVDTPDPAILGEEVTYCVFVTNLGPSDATGVEVLTTLPANLQFVSVDSTQGSNCQVNGQEISCALGGIVVDASAKITIVAIPLTTQTVVLRTEVDSAVSDPVIEDNSAEENTEIQGVAPTPTRTLLPSEDCDSGYYVLDSLGGRHRVGNPFLITGPLYFGNDIARDMERAVCSAGPDPQPDLVVLDGLGAAHFVTDEGCNIPQDFYFDNRTPPFQRGRAVDLVMASDSQGFWVLTDFGGIYRAGSAKEASDPAAVPGTDTNSTLGFDVPIEGELRDPNLPSPGGASLRAVALVVIDEDGDSRADGYVVLDSMGGRLYLGPDGSAIAEGFAAGSPANSPARLLDPAFYVWPFFIGLDIARDMEVFPSQQGVVILDGWGGIHPVPVGDEANPVFFAQNIVSATDPTPAQAIGMPYVTAGFDNPMTTEVDESDENQIGFDVASIFADLEFSVGCADGLYTLDRFGGVFALGSVRDSETEPVPGFGNSPYFFPLLYAEDMEVFSSDEQPGPDPTPTQGPQMTKFNAFDW